uniref:SQUAMOSA promoter-binding-like 11 n=1 Tax=Erycina pusilla TaxID=154679 RepID=M9QXM2_9ASPA|nr:SQUAMOSA promoter-binding-like 11 [Erycina pusilla]
METNFGGENDDLFSAGSSKRFGKKAVEWDLNDWKWDGDLFMATPVNPGPLNCLNKDLFPDRVLSNSSSSCSDDTEFGVGRKLLGGEADKRRRIVAVDDDEQCDDPRSLTLKLGAHAYPVMEEDLNLVGMKNGKRVMVQVNNPNHPKCQVQNCCADLSQSKDYHRRHKVCEMHAKASSAVVGNVIQRFCQQCSRFHLLQEFDEGKRSCRRRLAGHNKRRRKTLSGASTPCESSAVGDQSASYLLISLLRVLANLNSERSEQSKDQDFLSNLLRNIASLSGSSDGQNSPALLQASQDLQKTGTSAGTLGKAAGALISGPVPAKENMNSLCLPAKMLYDPPPSNHCVSPVVHNHSESPVVAPRERYDKSLTLCSLEHMVPAACTIATVKEKGFDLNTVCYEGEHGALGSGRPVNQATLDNGSSNCPSWMLQDSHQSSPPQTSGNTDSTSNRSPSSSNGDAQIRTDRIVFKLFGKNPNDFPLALRAQIFDWLSNSPTDMESYIRPGCIVFTVYLRLDLSMWDELFRDLGSRLKRLLLLSNDDFWRMGWIYTRVQNHIAFIYNGQIVLNKSLIMERSTCSRIVSITPIAVPPTSRVTFKVKGFNILQSATRLLCAFEGKYLIEERSQPGIHVSDNRSNGNSNEELQSLNFSFHVPDSIGRGFMEIEDNGLSTGFFPFIVAEEDICVEIQMLESSMNASLSEAILEERPETARNLGMDFLHEMGWLLHRHQLSLRSENSCSNSFSLPRFRWILRFAIDRDWSATVKKFLDILFEGNIETNGRSPYEVASSEYLLHYAVQRNSNLTVKLLLRYKPDKISDDGLNNIFRPDMPGPSGITPLHVAAASSFAESMLNILTDDPGLFGVKAWTNARDSTGFTPKDYAQARGQESSVLMMQKKINKIAEKGDVVVNMPCKLSLPSDAAVIYKQSEGLKSNKLSILGIDKSKSKQSQPPFCKLCEQHLACRSSVGRSLLYRPMLLSMVGIAAVCVCVGLLFKGPPEVMFVYPPFRWELLESGFM